MSRTKNAKDHVAVTFHSRKISWVEPETVAETILHDRTTIEVSFNLAPRAKPTDQMISADGVEWVVDDFIGARLLSGHFSQDRQEYGFTAIVTPKRIVGVLTTGVGGDTDPGAWEAEIHDPDCGKGDHAC